MQPFANTTFLRQGRHDEAPTRQPATVMQILNARPHCSDPAVQQDMSQAFFNVQSPQDVDFFGQFEEDAIPGTGSHGAYPYSFSSDHQAKSSSGYSEPYFPNLQGLTEPCVDLDPGDIDLCLSPNVVDFMDSDSFGPQPLEHTSFQRPPEIYRDSQWPDGAFPEVSLPSDAGRLQIPSIFPSPATFSSSVTCPSLTEPSWNSSNLDKLHTPRSFDDPDSFEMELGSSNNGSFQNETGAFEPSQGADLSEGYTWYNSDTSNNHASLKTFPSFGAEISKPRTISFHPTFNTISTNLRHPHQSKQLDDLNNLPSFPVSPTGLPQEKIQQTWSEIDDQPRRSSARADPLYVPINTKKSSALGKSLSSNGYEPSSYDCFVMQNGPYGTLKKELSPRKAIRQGHLPVEKAKTIAERRKNATTCIRCRTMRIECDEAIPCQKCIKATCSLTIMFPCTKAAFFEIVKSGTLNYISQRAINHFTLDESRRIQMFLPKEFNVDQLLNLLSTRKEMFNIRARQASGSLYVLDLANCYDFLKRLRRGLSSSKKGDLRSFIDDTLAKSSPWSRCVRECDPTKDKVVLLSKWNIMPSRASYSIVSLVDGVPDRPLDPEAEHDIPEILIAAQVSRIICRKLEIDGYKALQTTVNNMTRSQNPEEKIQFVQELGRILCSLRWRMSWWQLLGDGSAAPDPFRARFVERVTLLSRVLYFYFFALKEKIEPFYDLSGLRGVWSAYPDSQPIFDDFPLVSSIEAFEEWVARGKDLIREADVQGRFSK